MLPFLFFVCGMRDSKRPLRSKEQSGGLFVGRVRVGERKSEPSESRNPLHNKERRSLVLLLFIFYEPQGETLTPPFSREGDHEVVVG